MLRTLTSSELAEALGVSLSTAQRMIRDAHRTGAEHATHTERPQGRTGRQVVRAVRMVVV